MEEKMKSILFDELYFQINQKELPNRTKNNRDHELKTIYEQKTGKSVLIMTKTKRIQLYEWLKKEVRYPLLNDLIKSEIGLLVDPYFALKLTDEHQEDQFINTNLSSLLEIIRMQAADSIFLVLQDNTTSLSKITIKEREDIISQILLELDPSGKWLMIYYEAKEQGRIINVKECSSKEKEILCKKLELSEDSLSENACIRNKINHETYLLLTLVGTTEDILTIMHEFGHYLFYYYNLEEEPNILLKEFYPTLLELLAEKYLKKQRISEEECNRSRIENTAYLGQYYMVTYDYIDKYLTDGIIKEEEDIQEQATIMNNHKGILEEIFKEQADLFSSQTIAYQNCDSCIEKIISNPLELRQSFSYILGHYLAKQGVNRIIQDRQVLDVLREYIEHGLDLDLYGLFKLVGCDVDKLNLKPTIESTNRKNKEKSLKK